MLSSLIDNYEDYANDAALQAEYVDSLDANNPVLETTNPLDGLKSAKLAWTNSGGVAQWNSSPTGRDCTGITGTRLGNPTQGYLRVYLRLGQTGAVTTIRFRPGSDATRYTEVTFTPDDTTDIQEAILPLASGSHVGNPYWENMDYFGVFVDETDDGYVIIDNAELIKVSPTIKLKVNEIDRGYLVDKSSFEFDNVANDEVDTLKFVLKINQSNLSLFKPNFNDTVQLISNSTTLFAGRVLNVREEEADFNVYHVECTVKDYSYDFVKRRVVDAFEDVTDLYVVNNIINDYLNDVDKKIIDGCETGWEDSEISIDDFEYANDAAIQAEWIETQDGNNPTVDSGIYHEGTKSGVFGWTYSTGTAKFDATPTSVDLSGIVGATSGVPPRGYFSCWIKPADYTKVSSLQFRFGSSSSNYLRMDYTVASNNDWQHVELDMSNPTGSSLPAGIDWTAIDILTVTIIESASSSFNIDDIRVYADETISYSTDYFIQGTQSLQLNDQEASKDITLDLTEFTSGNASDTGDYIDFWFYVTNKDVMEEVQIRMGDSELKNYQGYKITSGFVTGWNYFHEAKSDFTEYGTMAWSDIVRVAIASTGATNVYFDDIRLISSDGFDKENIDTSVVVPVSYLPFNYLPAFQAMQDLCNLTGKYWYVDENKSVHYFPAGFELASFGVTDTNGNMIRKSLVVNEDGSQVKTKIFVRGSNFLSGTLYVQEEVGDGQKRSWNLDYTGQTLKIYIDRGAGYVEEDVGLDNIDSDDGTYDWFWNNSEKVVKQASAGTVLSSTDKIKATYYPYYPVLIDVPDDDAIEEYGINEMLIIDKNIKSKLGAKERALAELNAYKASLVDVKFETLTDGLRAGQQINIDSDKRDLDQDFVIWSVNAKMQTEDEFRYSVDLISKKKLTLANTLIQLLLEKTKDIEVDSNETLDKYFPHREDIEFQEAHTETVTTASAGKYGPDAAQGTYNTYFIYS